jgi:hypothetical protein
MSASTNQPDTRWASNPYGAALGDRDAVTVLADMPGRYRVLAERMTPAQFSRSYAPGKWTAAQLFLHLTQTELAFSVRLRMALTSDNYVVQPFEQDHWMQREPLVGGREAFASYASLRQFNLPLYRSLTAAEQAKVFQHPERGEMRVGWILELLAGHDLHHLAHMETIAAGS